MLVCKSPPREAEPKKFNLSLMTCKSIINPKADIGFRMSVYFRENIIIRNARINGQWGEEEAEGISRYSQPNPIPSGDFFMIYILACEDKFHISINSIPYCTFKYRLPLESLRAIELKDQIQAIKQIDHRSVFPNPWPPIHASDYFKAFSNDAPILFSPGHVIVITARCFNNKKGQFIIKFMDTDTKREELHFSVRFDEKVVVRNSHNSKFEFGQEERHGHFPFVFNQQFKLAIAFTESEFLTAVDGYNFCSYAYRTPNILQKLVGFKIACTKGLHMHVTGVDHVQTGNSLCRGFEELTRFDKECT
ncbi:32 kDa beta-galactoside-binding lectin isoform X2 [Stomoxys calcitrans]|uniref:Galectin n=1 Tax=Stomoxys calcitrans TaxID=35570 RepID=A0A1I8PQ76_STOCA|nr:32 kDa beta-galactoside-binding lectin isoform X2 [Stomoxys calcitrans]